jgi:uncharacterized membrane protein
MDELPILILMLVAIAVVLAAISLPIIALVISIRSKRTLTARLSKLDSSMGAIAQLHARIEKLEAAMATDSAQELREEHRETAPEQPAKQPAAVPGPRTPPEATRPSPVPEYPPIGSTAQRPAVPPVLPSAPPISTKQAERIESIIGRRWLGWAAVSLILFAVAFFLKYAFDNRWIGELGRVAIGVSAGVGMTVWGFKYHKRGWRVFSQILTGGGVVLLYVSVYAAFGYYHLATQRAAFVYLAILVAEAAGLAFLYDAPSIAIMALIGGFLAPILLRSDHDQYASLFGYIVALDVGALVIRKHWKVLSSLAFAGTHLLFWLWFDDHYHPRKLGAVMVFQTAVFLAFLLAHMGRQLFRHRSATIEDLALLLINPFVFFATAYYLLNPGHHDWMGVFAIGMALVYAGAVKLLLDRSANTRRDSLAMIGVALTFVILAIPIQLRSNWITIAWSVEALVMLWAGIETRSRSLRATAGALFALALVRLVFWDTPFDGRPLFTPVLNRYFLSALVVTACLLAAALVYQKLGKQKQISAPKLTLVLLLTAIVTLWLVMSVETVTFFGARAAQKLDADADHERWLGQMALSVLWSTYAGVLAAIGFLRRSASVRWAALVLFGWTVIKVMVVDIATLQQFYRIVVFFVLGVLLLVVAWGYTKAFHSRESSK